MEITPLGDSALLIRVAENFDDAPGDALNKVLATKRGLEAAQIPGTIETAPAYTTVALFYDPTRAIDAGATLATHLFNGMRPLHHREPGVIAAALGCDLACEVINDGVHVHPAITALVARDPRRLVLITDGIDAAGVGDGDFVLGGQDVRVHDGQARLAATGSLAGSTLTMDDAVRRAVLDSGLPIQVASAAASGNPARVLGIDDRCGRIAPGLDADFVVLDDNLQVTRVIAAGDCPVG